MKRHLISAAFLCLAVSTFFSCEDAGTSGDGGGSTGTPTTDPIVDITFSQIGSELDVPGRSAVDYIGSDLAIDGDYAIIGAGGMDSNRGGAYIFEYDGSSWSQMDFLLSDDIGAGDIFGGRVDISGDYAIAGASWEDGGSSAIDKAGSAYIFERSGSTWNQVIQLFAETKGEDDYFGHDVAISGDLAAVSAYYDDGDDGGSQDNCGAVYIYTRESGSWVLDATLREPVVEAGCTFGYSLDLDGNYLVVGAKYKDQGTDTNAGGVYFYERVSGVWELKSSLGGALGLAADDHLGVRAAIDGDTAVVGATGVDYDSSTTNSGAVYIFNRASNGTWTFTQELYTTYVDTNDKFGDSVAVSGNLILVGAPCYYYSTYRPDQGLVYLYKKNSDTGTWAYEARFQPPYEDRDDDILQLRFGQGVALDGEHGMISLPGKDFDDDDGEDPAIVDAGTVYVLAE